MITCREVTDWLLAADLREIWTPADRALGEHVAACDACAARAARIAGDSRRLARLVPAAPAHPRWRRSTYVATALLAASILVLLSTRGQRTEVPNTPGVERTDVASDVTQPGTSSSNPQRETPSAPEKGVVLPVVHRYAAPSTNDRLAVTTAVAPVAVIPQATPAVPIPAERLDTPDMSRPAGAEARPSLAVDVVPSSGRYAVLSSTPKVTVVWFY